MVKFIQDHESRIHLETQFIDGEETNVWKWVAQKHMQSLTKSENILVGITCLKTI